MQWRKREGGLLLGLVDFHGHPIQKKFLRTSRLRICPHCIRETQIVRDAWSLFYMTACAFHSVKLVDSCDRCCNSSDEATPLKFSSATHPWNCHCERHFGEIGTRSASRDALLVSRALENALGGALPEDMPQHSICAEIAALPLNDLMTFVDIIGTAATTPAHEDVPDNRIGTSYRHGLVDPTTNLDKCAQRAEAAGRIVASWPASYQQLLGEIAHRNANAPHHQVDRKAFATKIGSMLLFPRRSVAGVPLKILQDQIDEFCASALDVVRRKRNLATQDARALLVHRTANMSALARGLGLNSRSSLFQKAYRQVIDNISLNEGNIDPEVLASNLQRSVAALLQRSEDSISGTAAAAILEGAGPERRLQGWDHPELLHKIPASIDFFGKRKVSYSLSETLALRDRFIALAKSTEPCPSLCRLPVAMRMILSATYKKADFLVDLLNEKLPLYVEDAPEHVFDLLLDTKQLRSFMLQYDLEGAFRNERFLRLAELNRLAARVSSKLLPLTSADMKLLRRDSLVRFREEQIFDGRRHHPSYKYSARDVFDQILPAELFEASSADTRIKTRNIAPSRKFLTKLILEF
ncbi:MAG: TniQ family protein [Sphingomonadales bacterium]|nr:TniQ family protein [Sphingomonadales bacterium]